MTRRHGTHTVEHVFGALSSKSRGACSGKMEAPLQWASATHSGVLEANDSVLPDIDDDCRGTQESAFPSSFFKGTANSSFSLGKRTIDEMMDDKTPTPCPERHQRLGLLNSAVARFSHDPRWLQRIWRSLLFVEYTGYRQASTPEGPWWFVVAKNDVCAIAVSMTKMLVGDAWLYTLKKFGGHARQYTELNLVHLDDWVGVSLEPLPPVDLRARAGAAWDADPRKFSGVWFEPLKEDVPVMELAAEEAFKSLTVPAMQRVLREEYGLEGREIKNLEREVCWQLVSLALPDLDEDGVSAILKKRHSKHMRTAHEAAVSPEDIDALEEVMGEEEAQAAARDAEPPAHRGRAKAKARAGGMPGEAAPVAPVDPAEPAAAAAAQPDDVEAPAAPPLPLPAAPPPMHPADAASWTQEDLNALKPMGVPGSFLHIARRGAFVAKFAGRVTPGWKSRTVKWDPTIGLAAQSEALRETLHWLWDRHQEAGYGACPFDIDSIGV